MANMMPDESPLFSVVASLPRESLRKTSHVYLVTDNWDDWDKYRTQFSVHVIDAKNVDHFLGSAKIGEVGLRPKSKREVLAPGFRAPTLESEFATLGPKHFSVGQSENYYETLNEIDDELFRTRVLEGLRDCAYDLTTLDLNLNEDVMSESLLRDVQERNVRYRYHRLANGDAILTRFQFSYTLPGSTAEDSPPTLTFKVRPHSEPPTNVHVLIGRNGVGKTRCIQNLITSVLRGDSVEPKYGRLERLGDNAEKWTFAGVVSVSFSAFDDFHPPSVGDSGIRASQIGLRAKAQEDVEGGSHIKTPVMLADDFVDSLELCRSGPRARRWVQALDTLETDSLFKEANVRHLLYLEDEAWKAAARKLFRKLSSGHAIVLLTMTRLVELVDERTLVILDEPEGHLHPPLLAAFVRAIADLLGKRNGVALVATHSPVVLQEVPMLCAWKLRRSGAVSVAERPTIETFGENVGILTSEVFGLDVTRSGFHSLLEKAVRASKKYEDILDHFSGELGSEARAIVRGLIAAEKHG
ncbi:MULTISPECIES: AAA family ATPase [unclassified Caballeronia]|uniref:AAA family ATPase n=1 Tax=unclassified Caballeronia TaxID=2646786 RepID=UPI001F1F3EC7|nr:MULTISPECIES: AAA family ATPase [unclassified Caballeronia]MCE4547227.1 ATP-binding protein [Caballeronia sp. PC1]MCE4575209.1 ATP-binding protein [Caballeronia sp. CLC5]